MDTYEETKRISCAEKNIILEAEGLATDIKQLITREITLREAVSSKDWDTHHRKAYTKLLSENTKLAWEEKCLKDENKILRKALEDIASVTQKEAIGREIYWLETSIGRAKEALAQLTEVG